MRQLKSELYKKIVSFQLSNWVVRAFLEKPWSESYLSLYNWPRLPRNYYIQHWEVQSDGQISVIEIIVTVFATF